MHLAEAQGCTAGTPASTLPTCATSPRWRRRAAPCIAAQGVPDVVIANAGISVGIDTEVFEDLEVMRPPSRPT